MKKLRLPLCLVGLLYPSIVYANVAWPALILETRLFAWWPIVIGLTIEYFFIRKLCRFEPKKALIADLVVNSVSAVVGIALIPMTGLLIATTMNMLGLGFYSTFTWGATFIMACFLNTVVEWVVLERYFKIPFGICSIQFIWLTIANTASVGVAIFSLWKIPPLIY